MKDNLLHLRSLLTQSSYNLIDFDKVDVCLTDVEEIISKQKNKDRYAIEETNMDILRIIKFLMDYLIKEQNNNEYKNKLIKHRDQLFGRYFKNVFVSNEKRRVTNIFNEFIKGITFFAGESSFEKGQPIYHRKQSCTPRGQKNIICNSSNSNKISDEKKNRIRNCYIERLIYDKVWTSIVKASQDIQHVIWLAETKKAYNTCFPHVQIFVDVQFTENNIPFKLIITEEKEDDYNEESTEIYEKVYDYSSQEYIYPVYCLCIKKNKKFRKDTTFTKDDVWKVEII